MDLDRIMEGRVEVCFNGVNGAAVCDDLDLSVRRCSSVVCRTTGLQ